MHSAKSLACLSIAAVLLSATSATAACVGDCDGGGSVEINELVVGVNIALSMAQASACPAFDADDSGTVTIDELIAAVNNALRACPATPTASATSTESPTEPPTATATSTSEPTATSTEVPPPTSTATVGVDTATATLPPTSTATLAAATATATVASETPSTPTSTSALTATVTPTAVSGETPSASPTASLTTTSSASATPSGTPTQPAGDTATPTATFTPTFTPTMGPSAVCGNGILEPGENCTGCAADCAIGQCSATATMASFQISFQSPPGTTPITATTLLGYRSDRISIPGSGNVLSVRQRVVFPAPLPNTIAINDLDYAVRVVLGRTAGIAAGLLYTATFDTCQGAPAVHAEDFACTMEACAGAGGAITGCTCTVVEP